MKCRIDTNPFFSYFFILNYIFSVIYSTLVRYFFGDLFDRFWIYSEKAVDFFDESNDFFGDETIFSVIFSTNFQLLVATLHFQSFFRCIFPRLPIV